MKLLKISAIAMAVLVSLTACGEEKKQNAEIQSFASTQAEDSTEKNSEVISEVVKKSDKSDKKAEKENDKQAKKPSCQNNVIVNAYKQGKSDTQVKGCAVVIKVLPDDTKGHKHQKMIVKLTEVSPKRTVLIAHNIDLAPRVKDLRKGDKISFYGEYEYNDRGGVVHWTHHDPAGRHQDGWIEKNGKRYQ